VSAKSDAGMRRLLIITYHFPPDGAIGGERWAGLSKYLARLGWEVHVVTASPPSSGEAPSDVHRHFCPPRRTSNDLYRAAIGRLRSVTRASNGRDTSANPGRSPRFSWLRPFSALRRVLASSIYFPDYGRGWVSRAASVARALLEDREFDVVITSGPPHSAHFAGLFAIRGGPVPLWIDMRDPWAASPAGQVPQDQLFRAERFLLSRLEKLLFQRASKVIANTLEFATSLSDAEPTLDVVYFPNGIDLEQLPARDPRNVQRRSIACLGTLYAGRNLSSVLAAMRAVLSERPEDAAALRLNIAGPIDAAHHEQLLEEIATSGLGTLVQIHGVIPRIRALDLLNRSHLALVLAQGQPMQVPAKLYECVGLGTVTLVITEEVSASAREARRIGATVLADGDIDGIRSILNEMLDGRLPTKIEPAAPISYLELGVQMDRLLREALDAQPMR
jgi:glycosyltransferase involved in cell wall biosynthesis